MVLTESLLLAFSGGVLGILSASWSVLGLVAGIAAASFLVRAIRGLLFGVQPTDPLTIAGVAVVLVAVSVLACLIPAARRQG